MAERRRGSAATLTLAVNGGSLALDAAAGRTDLRSVFARRTVRRTLPGGRSVTVPLSIRDGTVTCVVLRTAATDRLLCGANQQIGTLTLREQGTGRGLPQRTVQVIVTTALTVASDRLSMWRITCTATGSATDTAQT